MGEVTPERRMSHPRDRRLSARTWIPGGLALGLALASLSAGGEEVARVPFPTFSDPETVALWLFDEARYPHVTLTDAGPHEYDLRLMGGGQLVEGRFGRALQVAGGPELAVAFAGFKGAVPADQMREAIGPSGLFGPTVSPGRLLRTFAEGDWTLELWLRVSEGLEGGATLLDLGHGHDSGVRFDLGDGHDRFLLENHYAGAVADFPTGGRLLSDGRWHHIALTWERGAGRVRGFVDGAPVGNVRASPVPRAATPPVVVPGDRSKDAFGFTASASHEWRRAHRFNLALGHDRRGGGRIGGALDEVRLSSSLRYARAFTPPASLSRHLRPQAPPPSRPSGPPLLFASPPSPDPVRLGSRRHLFIDGALLEESEGLQFTANPPSGWRPLDLEGMGGRQASVLDRDGTVLMYVMEGYSSAEGDVRLLQAQEGLLFRGSDPGAGAGSEKRDLVLHGAPLWGVVFEDQNPNVGTEERFKLTAWVANRGIYLYLSPDGRRWRRNETGMLPLVSGGAAETYWDDQRGVYVTLLKRDGDFNTPAHPGRGRRAVGFETREITKPWPFQAVAEPLFAGWPMPVVTGEGPVVFEPSPHGEVFRTRVMKYPWAPDVYLAFLWRFDAQERRLTDLGVSRDGRHWRFFADQGWYLGPRGDYVEAMAQHGLIRRDSEIWQYAEYGTGAHGDGDRTFARVTQRLDGFVSLDAGDVTGTALSRPLAFQGRRLELNVAAASGGVRVELLDEEGRPLPGRTLADCDPIQTDAVAHPVTWGGDGDVSAFSGRPVRLRLAMRSAKLYALQFVDQAPAGGAARR